MWQWFVHLWQGPLRFWVVVDPATEGVPVVDVVESRVRPENCIAGTPFSGPYHILFAALHAADFKRIRVDAGYRAEILWLKQRHSGRGGCQKDS